MAYYITFINVFVMLVYLACGYGLVKFGKAEAQHAKSVSGLLVYICTPCMILSAFQNMEYSKENLFNMFAFLLICLFIQLLFYFILYLLLHKKFDKANYRILTAGSILGNVGFFGLPLVTSLFPDNPEVACYSTLYVTGMNLIVFTIGAFLITNDKKYISLKSAFLNPATITAAVSIPLFLMQIKLPSTIGNTVSLLGKMTTPICMIVLGFRMASMNLKKIFIQRFAYVVCAVKLIVFPIFTYLCIGFLPWFDDIFKNSLLVLSGTPSAAVILSLSELHNCEQKLCADVVLLTTIASIITLPIIMLIL